MKKVLLVDDDSLTVEFMKLYLIEEGFEVVCAFSLSEAFSAFENEKPDCVVTDVQLSDGSGIHLAQRVRENSQARVVGVTGYSSDVLEAAKEHFNEILTKPIDLNALKDALLS